VYGRCSVLTIYAENLRGSGADQATALAARTPRAGYEIPQV
jgi:hypothetical protein